MPSEQLEAAKQTPNPYDDYLAPTLLIARDEKIEQAYNDFMWIHHGHPHGTEPVPPRSVEVPHYGLVSFDNVHASSFGTTSLVHVRSSYRNPQLFFVTSTDLRNGEATDWRIDDVRSDGPRKTTIWLTRRWLEAVPADPDVALQNPLEQAVQRKLARLALDQARIVQPQVIMTSQGIEFVTPRGERQMLEPIVRLHQDLQRYRQHFGSRRESPVALSGAAS